MILIAALLLQSGSVAALDAELQAATSATAVLQKRCAVPIRAQVDRQARKEAPEAVRAHLEADRGVPLVYRLVRLSCGPLVYSRAENWYRPDRLSAAMNDALETGEVPFGVAVRPLAPARRTLGSETAPEPHVILRHRAIVLAGNGAPLAEVVESYTPDMPLEPLPAR